MPRSAGTYTAPASSWNPAVNTASATFADWNSLLTDISNALTQSLSLDGQSVPTANIPMGGFRLTGLGSAVATTDAVNKSDVTSLIAANGRGYLAGLTLSTAGSSPTFSVAVGSATDSTMAAPLTLGSAMSKTTSAWSVGTAAGGLDTGVIANSTWYHVYLIRRPDTAVVDVIFSTSASLPTLPTNYTQYRRIGSLKTDGSAQWTKFIQDGDYFQWDAAVNDYSVTAAGTSAVTRTLSVPTGVNVRAAVKVGVASVPNSEAAVLSDLAVADAAASTIYADVWNFAGGNAMSQAIVRTNTSAQIRSRCFVGGATEGLRITTVGWYDTRGRDA